MENTIFSAIYKELLDLLNVGYIIVPYSRKKSLKQKEIKGKIALLVPQSRLIIYNKIVGIY